MSDSNQPVDNDASELENFENQFYGLEKKEGDFVDENEDNSLETEEPDEEEEQEDEDGDEEDSPEEEEDEEEPEPEPVKAKKKTFQSRIDEITARAYEAERREALLRQELEALKTEVKPQAKEEKSDVRAQLPSDAPSPDAVDDAGEPVYPLGEFDPKFIADLTRFTIKVESERAKAEAEQEAAARAAAEAKQEIVDNYAKRFEEAAKEIPDLRESVLNMAGVVGNIPDDYGEYLATTIMSLENGPQLMYYLSQNIGEAQKIVASGPAAATLALGRLDARLSKPKQEEKRNKIVSDAPPPPNARSRGSSGRFEPNPDTDDLEAFERIYYKK